MIADPLPIYSFLFFIFYIYFILLPGFPYIFPISRRIQALIVFSLSRITDLYSSALSLFHSPLSSEICNGTFQDIANTAARQKEIMVLLKIYWGDAWEKICEAIDNIPLSCLVIGN
ncbi:unnamed protein product [Camellia sinensis]